MISTCFALASKGQSLLTTEMHVRIAMIDERDPHPYHQLRELKILWTLDTTKGVRQEILRVAKALQVVEDESDLLEMYRASGVWEAIDEDIEAAAETLAIRSILGETSLHTTNTPWRCLQSKAAYSVGAEHAGRCHQRQRRSA